MLRYHRGRDQRDDRDRDAESGCVFGPVVGRRPIGTVVGLSFRSLGGHPEAVEIGSAVPRAVVPSLSEAVGVVAVIS